MTDYIHINPTEYEPEAPLTSSLAARMVNNPIAIAEGAPGAPKIRSAAIEYTDLTAGNYAITRPVRGDTENSSYTKLIEWYCNRGGTVSVRFEFFTVEGSARIYRNGAAVGTTRSSSGTYTESVTIAPGDLLQIYARETSGVSSSVISNAILAVATPEAFGIHTSYGGV